MVDCEGWDWFSRRAAASRVAATAKPPAAQAAQAPDVDALLTAGSTSSAFAAWSRRPSAVAPAAAFRLAARLVQEQRWEDAEAVADRLLAAPLPGNPVRLLGAWVMVQRNRPSAALEQLALLVQPTEAESGKAERIRTEAQRRRADLTYELA
jgi:hypothetical protein